MATRLTTTTLVAVSALALFSGAAAAQSVTYENTVKSILAERCLSCHGKGAPTLAEFDKDKAGWTKKMKGPRIDDYENLMILVNGSDAGAFMRRLDDGKNTKDGKPGNMYVFLGRGEAERAQRLDTMKQWVGNWSLKRRKELTEDELRSIKAAEK
jgi:mono/diheme cytochrome c family protein